jgi:hypothetical protein
MAAGCRLTFFSAGGADADEADEAVSDIAIELIARSSRRIGAVREFLMS